MGTSTVAKPKEKIREESITSKKHDLIIWNDDVNTFDWVIECLVDVCGHDEIQAEQCAWLIHHTGKTSVKYGDLEMLKPMCDALLDRKISAQIL